MLHIGTKLAAIGAGVLAYWLCVPVETPGIDFRACCAPANWGEAANVRPGWPRRPKGRHLIARGPAPHSWTVAGIDGKPAAQFTLPEPLDRVLARAVDDGNGSPERDAQGGFDEEWATIDAVFYGSGPGGGPGGYPPWKACRHDDDAPWCKKHHPRPIPGAVPEPGVWALMITGLVILGAGLRRNRRSAAEATAGR